MSKLNTTPRTDGFRMPGEFEKQDGCLMIWPWRPGSWNFEAKEAREVFAGIAKKIAEQENLYMMVRPEDYENACRMLLGAGEGNGQRPADENKSEGEQATASGQKPSCEPSSTRAQKPSCELSSTRAQNTSCDPHPNSGIHLIKANNEDAWARDTGATFVIDDAGNRRGIDWEFNAWGGDYDGLYAHWENDQLVAEKICEYLKDEVYDAHPFVLEGGPIHTDGEGTLLTTEECLLSPGRNPSMTREQIEEKLREYLNVETIIWLPEGIFNDETNGHIDNMCCFSAPGEVLLAWTDDQNDPQYARSMKALQILENSLDAKGRKIKVRKLPIPAKPICIEAADLEGYDFEEGEDTREVGERLAASYVNFYIANHCILLPQFGDENDKVAVEILTECFPDREIVPVPARAILTGGGNIHCITQQIPAR